MQKSTTELLEERRSVVKVLYQQPRALNCGVILIGTSVPLFQTTVFLFNQFHLILFLARQDAPSWIFTEHNLPQKYKCNWRF